MLLLVDNYDSFTYNLVHFLGELGAGCTIYRNDAITVDGIVSLQQNGVEIGQVIALTGVLIALSYWRTRSGFLRHAFVTNGVLMACGFLLVGYQLSGYFLGA